MTALSQTRDCDRLQRAALSIDRVAQRHAKVQDAVETGAVFEVYVRRLVGRAAQVCSSLHEFQLVRRPMRDTLMKIPDVGDLTGKVDHALANRRVAEILRERCDSEVEMSGASDCREIYAGYVKLCASLAPAALEAAKNTGGKPSVPDAGSGDHEPAAAEQAACALMQEGLNQLNARIDREDSEPSTEPE